MRVLVQRVSRAQVLVDGQVKGQIGPGLVLLVGIHPDDDEKALRFCAEKCAHLRIFPDEAGKMNRSVLDAGGSALVVSQFTLYGDCRKGRRPSFTHAAPPDLAERLYEAVADRLRERGLSVETGRFQAMMDVALVNDGPVTLILDSKRES